ncbi:molecular chaperone [Sphingorhabdus sp. EL138]|jgi:P pilus assembly chaperone PapD|uniref:fimbrial biogenesis chaperone n=1 Tax=Sphingorhabdus sp. EL138 TaxID=2073156 RepID=UPI001572141E|nr:molecular chaperone [Sphingorhabdus sp. EL138]
MTIRGLKRLRNICVGLGAAASAVALSLSPAQAAGDLLVAPTRIVLDGQRGTEIILNNIGSETATYRISLELRRMTAEGRLTEVSPEDANELEQAAKEMIRYAPRRVTLPPNQPQAIRLGVRAPKDLADGEYRVHLLFRAIPKARSVTASPEQADGFSIALTPIYGVTIPVIIRQGNLSATAAIANARIEQGDEGKAFAFDLSRTGDRSTYGEIRVMKQGVNEPLLLVRGIAVYPELASRKVSLPVPPEVAAQLKGPLSIEYYEPRNIGGGLITKTELVLR